MSIESAAKAFARKGLPVKNWSISFSESDYYTIDVQARDEDEAKEKAWDLANNGGYGGNNVSTDIDNIDEGDIVAPEDIED